MRNLEPEMVDILGSLKGKEQMMVNKSGEGSHPSRTSPAFEGDIAIAYETFGDAADPPVLLIMGLGAQLLSWQEDFCQQLVDRGLFVVRFDNRDVGLSTHLHHAPLPDLAAIQSGDSSTAPYTLSDMASDAANLIESLGLGSAHVVGASMGGMIGQVLAIEHPDRVRSLTSIMSTTGDPNVGQSTQEAFAQLAQPAARTRAGDDRPPPPIPSSHWLAELPDQRRRASRPGRASLRP